MAQSKVNGLESKLSNLKIDRSDAEENLEDGIYDDAEEDLETGERVESTKKPIVTAVKKFTVIDEEKEAEKTKSLTRTPSKRSFPVLQGMSVSTGHRQIIVNRLNSMGLDGELFCQNLKSNGCLMAGSFPLQCLLGETYKGSDIDVFVARPNVFKTDGKNHDDHQLRKELRNYKGFEQWLNNKYHVKAKPNVYLIRDVICSRKYQITPEACVNIVLVDTKDLEKHILNSFDLSFCQTIFDGEVLKYWDITLKKAGYLSCRYGLKARQPYHISEKDYNRELLQRKSSEAKADYEETNILRVYVDPQATLKRRMDKYKSRGFFISELPITDVNSVDQLKLSAMTSEYKDLCKVHEEKLAELASSKQELETLRSKSNSLDLVKQKLAEQENNQELKSVKNELATTKKEMDQLKSHLASVESRLKEKERLINNLKSAFMVLMNDP